MNDASSADRDRLRDLAVDRALFGLDPAEQAEFEALSARYGDADGEAMERVAAMLELGGGVSVEEALPADLRRRVLEDAESRRSAREVQATRPLSNVGPSAPHGTWILYSGWLAAAACLLWALFAGRNQSTTPPALAAQRQQLIDSSRDVVRAEWVATDDPAAAEATGDVVWSSAAQRGFMRIRGLAANDPGDHQYQLWIVDSNRADPQPVDGGVFDIPRDQEEVILPIRAALAVGSASQFVITVEPPGGVVVSRQERVPLVAKVTAPVAVET